MQGHRVTRVGKAYFLPVESIDVVTRVGKAIFFNRGIPEPRKIDFIFCAKRIVTRYTQF